MIGSEAVSSAMEENPALPTLVAERLSPQQVRLAFPLMREVAPGLTLPTWLRYARRSIGRTGAASPGPASHGVLVVRRVSATHLCGAVCYRRDHDVRLGTVLTAEHFVAMDLLHPRAVLNALDAGLEVVATALGCAAVRAMVDTSHTARELEDCGHERRGEVLFRQLRQAPPNSAER